MPTETERARCAGIASRVASLAAQGWWGADEWSGGLAALAAAEMIQDFIQQGIQPEEVYAKAQDARKRGG